MEGGREEGGMGSDRANIFLTSGVESGLSCSSQVIGNVVFLIIMWRFLSALPRTQVGSKVKVRTYSFRSAKFA